MKIFAYLPTIIVKYLIRIVYNISTILFPVDPKKITFASYRSEQLKGNLAYIYKEISYEYRDYSCTFLFKKYHSNILGKLDYLIHMLKASYHLATSKYFFIDDYYFPIYAIKPRRETEIVQFWHAAGAFKKFGYSTVNKDFGPSEEYLKYIKIHSNYTKAIVSSSEVIPHYAEAFNMSEKRVLPLGVPRTDYFYDQEAHIELKDKFYNDYPELIGKKLILYAPTFRGKSHYQESFDFPIDFTSMKLRIGEEYAILVHLHPYMKSDIDMEENVKDFVYHISDGYDIQELMVITDLLITDYSSVVFDYSILLKPVAFLANDLESYLKERDFYIHYQEFIPGPFFTETKGLADWIVEGQFDIEEIRKFRNRYFDYIDGKATHRIVKAILESDSQNQVLSKSS